MYVGAVPAPVFFIEQRPKKGPWRKKTPAQEMKEILDKANKRAEETEPIETVDIGHGMRMDKTIHDMYERLDWNEINETLEAMRSMSLEP